MKIRCSGTVYAKKPLENTLSSQVMQPGACTRAAASSQGPQTSWKRDIQRGARAAAGDAEHHGVQAGAVLAAVRPRESHSSRPQPTHLCNGEQSP